VTRGDKSTLYADEEGKIKEFEIIKVDPQHLVDFNGAGDSFVGGFLAAQALGKNVDDSISVGLRSSWMIV